MKVDPDSDEPIPNQLYYMSGMNLAIGGKQKGKVHLLFPAELLQLEMLGREEELAAAQAAAQAVSSQQADGAVAKQPGPAGTGDGGDSDFSGCLF